RSNTLSSTRCRPERAWWAGAAWPPRPTKQGGVMRYALLVCDDESVELSPEEETTQVAAYAAFQTQMEARGVLVRRERLRPTSTATTVRVRAGNLVIADGPFAETKEQIAGIYFVECADLDEAIAVASQIPAARSGTIEVRPVWEG